MRRVAMLSGLDPEPYWGFFRDAMQGLGYAEGRDVTLELRAAGGKAEALERLASELVRSRVDVIVAHERPAVAAARRATKAVPIVMAPGAAPAEGNVTGVAANTAEVSRKTLELVREIAHPPRAARVAVLANADDPYSKGFVDELRKAGARIRVAVGVALVRTPAQYDAAFAEWDKLRVHGVVVQPGVPPRRAIELAARYRMLTVSPAKAFVEAGGLLSCSDSPAEIGRKAAGFVDRILKGARASELALEQATLVELAVNLKAAAAMGLELPESVIARADALIQ